MSGSKHLSKIISQYLVISLDIKQIKVTLNGFHNIKLVYYTWCIAAVHYL